MSIITIEEIRRNKEIDALVKQANHVLEVIGYTEHGPRHVGYVSHMASEILRALEYPDRTVELAAIAGWVHDVGNSVNRLNHGIIGGTLLYPILRDIGMPLDEVATIISAVGNHEEQNGMVVSEVSAALVIADKVDANRSRVRRKTYSLDDIHDRVNYAITQNDVEVDAARRVISYRISMNNMASVMEFLQIYLSRMQMCETAAEYLGCRFDLYVNGMLINRDD